MRGKERPRDGLTTGRLLFFSYRVARPADRHRRGRILCNLTLVNDTCCYFRKELINSSIFASRNLCEIGANVTSKFQRLLTRNLPVGSQIDFVAYQVQY